MCGAAAVFQQEAGWLLQSRRAADAAAVGAKIKCVQQGAVPPPDTLQRRTEQQGACLEAGSRGKHKSECPLGQAGMPMEVPLAVTDLCPVGHDLDARACWQVLEDGGDQTGLDVVAVRVPAAEAREEVQAELRHAPAAGQHGRQHTRLTHATVNVGVYVGQSLSSTAAAL